MPNLFYKMSAVLKSFFTVHFLNYMGQKVDCAYHGRQLEKEIDLIRQFSECCWPSRAEYQRSVFFV